MLGFCICRGWTLWNYVTSINISSKTPEKEAPQGNILEFFLLDALKTYIMNGKFNPKMNTIRVFLSKIRTLSDFQKGQGRPTLPTSCASVSVDEYASISLSMPKYLCRVPNMFDCGSIRRNNA